MAWHDASCADLHLEWEDGRPGCRTCQRRAPELTPIHPISPPAPPLHTSRSQLVCTWPPRVFSNLIRDEDQGYAAASGHDYDEEQKLRALICANIDEWTASHANQGPEPSFPRNHESLQQQIRPEPMLYKIYSRLPATDSIRLLCLHGSKTKSDPIHCDLLVWRLRDQSRPIFEALSYTWADSDGNSALCETIFIGPNYDTCLVTKNCMAALQRYRITVDRLIWVDAICINQFDLEERGQQVSLMREIFESASRVLIFADDESAKRVPIPNFTDNNYATSVDPRFILQIPYFSRIWVIQEVQLSNTATLTIGDVTIDWDQFLRYLSKYREHATLEGKRWVQHWVEHLNIEQIDMSTISLLRATLHCQSGDARDRLFGLLGLTTRNEQHDLPVDYSISIQQLYTGLAMYWLTAWGSWPLKSYILDLAFFPKVTSFLPSWVPDWESLADIETGREQDATIPVTLEFAITDGGITSSGLRWFGGLRSYRRNESQFRWTLDNVWKPRGTARPLQEAGVMVVDAVHLLSVSNGKVKLTDVNDNPLHGLSIAIPEERGPKRDSLLRKDAQLHVLVNWNRACLLRQHANKVYSLDSRCQILCGSKGIPTGIPRNTRQTFTHFPHGENDDFDRGHLSMREVLLASDLPLPGFPENGNISAISEQLAGLESEIVESWLIELFFFSMRAGSAITESQRCGIIQDYWKQRYPLAAAACQEPDWQFNAQVGESQEPVELAAMMEQRERVLAFGFENAALGFDVTGSAHIELAEVIEKIYKLPSSSNAGLLDAKFASEIQELGRLFFFKQDTAMEIRQFLDGVIDRQTNACKEFQPPFLATLQVNPFRLSVQVSTLDALLQSSNYKGEYKKKETVRLTVGEIFRIAGTLLKDLHIDEKYTIEQNLNVLWICVLTMEVIVRLRGVLQQRLVLKAMADKIYKVQRIYLI